MTHLHVSCPWATITPSTSGSTSHLSFADSPTSQMANSRVIGW
ncbi:hypothetical protein OG548_44725 [Streptomyces sp. NBC_01356]|nr:hypothetical protein [Streptomyces sp. NBC_01356]